MPSCIGSPEIKTVGISLVAPLAASSEGDAPVVTITATRRRTRSAAISRSRSYRPSRPTVFDDDVLTLNVAGFIQAPMKRGDELCEGAGRLAVEESNHWQGRLLRARRERPSRCAAEQRKELAPFQLIEWHSAPASQGQIAGHRIHHSQSADILNLVNRWSAPPRHHQG